MLELGVNELDCGLDFGVLEVVVCCFWVGKYCGFLVKVVCLGVLFWFEFLDLVKDG